MKIEINNFTKFKIDEKLFTGLAKKVIKGENKEIDLSLAFVCAEEIKKANKKYRGKNKPTDVLSFGEISKSEIRNPKQIFEILICPQVIKQNAKNFGVTFRQEMAKILIHGILHVCGYEHEKSEKEAKKMEAKENYYLNNI